MERALTYVGLRHLQGGRFEAAVNINLKQIANDCWNRPGLKKARKLTIEIEITPEADADGNYDQAEVVTNIKVSLPSMKGKETKIAPRGQHAFAFNDLATDNPRQRTIDEGEPVEPDEGDVSS